MKPADVCVVIPAYNEAKTISRIVTAVKALGFPVIVVDDGSGDGTATAAEWAGAHVVSYRPNQGKGNALRKGIEWFLDHTAAKAVIFMDSDGQHDPADLPRFLEALGQPEADFVIGNRMQNPEGMPLIRRLTNRFMSRIISFFSGERVPDTQCGYRAAKREPLTRVQLETSRFEIESEMILEAGRTGATVVSVPIRSVYEGGKSNIHPARDTARFFKFLGAYLARRRRR